ncbi:adenosylcobinamide-GDP ribazoletransferase [Aquabacterium sp. OR-4]|uniref:adenosylcobinamide-GDP ribazoletransferase n=1 Tax=Aquabacterium sp. OR-4 TaxID=2978127 RepID=UPI0021B1F397|nr:adenosylcobinamide-GDP ribazoletransferase [Aquabacterium sp. OR-4]MDT7836116.1 adenosylcobinamide-GDP ribazoletransferase [Aquabacterium sp. OR-4]
MLQALVHELRLIAVALQFLTRVPVRLARFDPAWLAQCTRHFPLVGAGVGAFGAAALALATALGGSPWVAAVAATAATVWLTGGFHEDGLADTCDGLGGAVSRERALVIMKDSRLGSYGALGLVLVLAAKLALLAQLTGQHSAMAAAAALVLAQAASRAGAATLLATLTYAGDPEHAKAKPLAQRIGAAGLATAWGWTLLVAVALGGGLAAGGVPLALPAPMPWRATLALLAVLLVAWRMRAWLLRRLGGFTGDTLGATQQFAELAVLVVAAAQPVWMA